MKVFLNLDGELPKNGIEVRQEADLLRIFFDYEKQETETQDSLEGNRVSDNAYTAENIDVFNSRKYDDIVSAIIESRYPADKMDAIRLNYELTKDSDMSITKTKSSEYTEEYKAMQQWRIHAKEIASKVVKMLNE